MFGGQGIIVGGIGKIVDNVRVHDIGDDLSLYKFTIFLSASGCTGRSWCSAGYSQDCKRCTSVNDSINYHLRRCFAESLVVLLVVPCVPALHVLECDLSG